MEKNIIVCLSPWAINLLQCFSTKKLYSFLEIKKRYDSVYPLEYRKALSRALGRKRPLEFGEALLNLLQSGCVFLSMVATKLATLAPAIFKGRMI